jgi:AAA domain
MGFKKLDTAAFPRRLWAMVGFPGSGKSTFAAQMRAPILPIDADQRFVEVAGLAAGDVYQLSDRPTDNVIVEQIAERLRANMPGSDVKTIAVDSLTAILAPLVTAAVMANDAGQNKNQVAAFKTKALAARLLADTVSMWGCDVLWIYHLQEGRDAKAHLQTTATVSRTELARLQRSINLQLRITQDGARRGILVEWARRGRAGMILWDDTGIFKGMPEKIEQAVYGGLTRADQERIEQATPATFPSPEVAIAWGFEQGPFQALQHARNAYDKMVAEHGPELEQAELWALWIADVSARKAAQIADSDAEFDALTGAREERAAQRTGGSSAPSGQAGQLPLSGATPGGDAAEIRAAGPWIKAAKGLAAAEPFYRNERGEPDMLKMARVAHVEGFPVVDAYNVERALAALAKRARQAPA